MKTIRDGEYHGKGISKTKYIDNVKYINCHFEKCNLEEYQLTVVEFEDCTFVNCNFSRAFLAMNKGYESGKFIRCLFNSCNFKATSFRFPVIESCEFRNCKLFETNFDGSRFSNTQFIGELDSCFFRGYSRFAGSGKLFSFSKFDLRKVMNEMVNVDFSHARLVGNVFENAIDLSRCKFPVGPEYVYISDLKTTVQKAIQNAESVFSDTHDREDAIRFIKAVYDKASLQEQKTHFIDSIYLSELPEGRELTLQVFDLMKSFA